MEGAGAMGKVAKQRVDQLLVERGLAESRTRAQALVLAGTVFSGRNEDRQARPAPFPPMPRWRCAGATIRGFRAAGSSWPMRSSTSGSIRRARWRWTSAVPPAASPTCCCSKGAAHVFAVDSGTNQLAWKLRQDPRVTVLEQTSARVLTPQQIDGRATGWCATPVSFRSPRCWKCRCGWPRPVPLVALIKPQFEVGRAEVGKGGVVRDPAVHERVCGEVRAWLEGLGWQVQGIVESPIKGPEGNVEFLISALRS
jgi:23S rRNA (cytidine1920-2'-O)/16S rRNA (cytidine1409-2'-O)-methyltransferase